MRVIAAVRKAGSTSLFVVSGFRGANLRAALDTLAKRDCFRINHIINDEWERANGLSVYKASKHLRGNFLLTMCDHLVEPEIIQDLLREGTEPDTVKLCVDFNLASPLNNPDDVTRVSCCGKNIERVGKVLKNYNAIDVGVFLCTPIMFDALEESIALGDDSISGAMNVLARWGKARCFDIGSRLWVDVDDPHAFTQTERLIEEGRL